MARSEELFERAKRLIPGGVNSPVRAFSSQLMLRVPEETTRNTLVLSYSGMETFEKAIKREGENIAAVIIEPVIGNAGVILLKGI